MPSNDKRRFKRIDTIAILPCGRRVTATRSYPLGVGKDVYDKIDADLVKAFGNDGARTIGTFVDDGGLSHGRVISQSQTV